jgi:hypothetical protein
MTVQSETEAVRQAKEYLDIGFVVNAIKRPDGSIAHDQDQLNALYHGFDDLALKLPEKRTLRNREETRRIESGKEAVEPKGWLTGLIPSEGGQATCRSRERCLIQNSLLLKISGVDPSRYNQQHKKRVHNDRRHEPALSCVALRPAGSTCRVAGEIRRSGELIMLCRPITTCQREAKAIPLISGTDV